MDTDPGLSLALLSPARMLVGADAWRGLDGDTFTAGRDLSPI